MKRFAGAGFILKEDDFLLSGRGGARENAIKSDYALTTKEPPPLTQFSATAALVGVLFVARYDSNYNYLERYVTRSSHIIDHLVGWMPLGIAAAIFWY